MKTQTLIHAYKFNFEGIPSESDLIKSTKNIFKSHHPMRAYIGWEEDHLIKIRDIQNQIVEVWADKYL